MTDRRETVLEKESAFWRRVAPAAEGAGKILARRTAALSVSSDRRTAEDADLVSDRPPPDCEPLVRRAWDLVQPAARLLTLGGDIRLAVDPRTGLNAYGCSPVPRPEAVTFASTTATSISEHAYRAAEDVRATLLTALVDGDADQAAIQGLNRVRAELRRLLRLTDEDIALCPSGTDGELYAVEIARTGGRLVNILVGAEETGSGVPKAAAFCHFAPTTAAGAVVEAGARLAGLEDEITLERVGLRQSDGSARTPDEIDAEVSDLVIRALADGAKVLLHLVDSSKTGLGAPTFAQAQRLKELGAGRVDVLVDACQMRLWPARIRTYLKAGFLVLVTASKFMTAPPFAAALFAPAELGRRIRMRAVPTLGLADYVGQGDWPMGWPQPQGGRRARPNIGLLLRWTAGLAELERFLAVPPADARRILEQFLDAVTNGFKDRPNLQLVPTRAPDAPGDPVFHGLQTILTFTVSSGGELLGNEDLKNLYRLANTNLGAGILGVPCHIGQPVTLGPRSALRLSAGARLVYESYRDPKRLDMEIRDALGVLDKFNLLAAQPRLTKSQG